MIIHFTVITPSGEITKTVNDTSIDRAFHIVRNAHPNWQAIGIVIDAPAGVGGNGRRNKTK